MRAACERIDEELFASALLNLQIPELSLTRKTKTFCRQTSAEDSEISKTLFKLFDTLVIIASLDQIVGRFNRNIYLDFMLPPSFFASFLELP